MNHFDTFTKFTEQYTDSDSLTNKNHCCTTETIHVHVFPLDRLMEKVTILPHVWIHLQLVYQCVILKHSELNVVCM